MNMAHGCAFNSDDMFYNFNMRKKLTTNCLRCEKIINDNHRDKLVKRVFNECVKQVINDLVDNNVTFILPTTNRYSELYVKHFKGEDFKKVRLRGGFQDVDFIESNFTGNNIFLLMKSKGRIREKPVYVDHNVKDKLTENTNRRKQYC